MALVVDDNRINLDLIDFLLREEGFQVIAVSRPEDALRVLDQFTPDLFVLDVQLPGMSGLDLLRTLRTRPDTGKSCAVIVTSYAMETDKQKAFAAGCDAYFTKPVDTRTFGAEVRLIFNRIVGRV